MIRTNQFYRQIAPLPAGECFAVFKHAKLEFDFPLHFHPEFELNFIYNAPGARRIVGDHTATINKFELVLTGPNLIHRWERGDCKSSDIHEITVLFHRDLFHSNLLERNVFTHIKKLLQKAQHGVLFPQELACNLYPQLNKLDEKKGFSAVLEFLEILNELSRSEHSALLSGNVTGISEFLPQGKLKKLDEFIQHNFQRKISLSEAAKVLNMTSITFIRFIKNRTGRTFIDFVNDYRISFAAKLLIETAKSVSEIAGESGFQNLSHFNRMFRKRKMCTPGEFRSSYPADYQLDKV